MTESLTVPTATSFRDISATTLDARRKALNTQLAASGKRISFTHLIGYAIVQAAKHFPVMTHAFQEIDGKWYRLEAAPSGKELKAAPVTVETGILKLDYKGGPPPTWVVVRVGGDLVKSKTMSVCILK